LWPDLSAGYNLDMNTDTHLDTDIHSFRKSSTKYYVETNFAAAAALSHVNALDVCASDSFMSKTRLYFPLALLLTLMFHPLIALSQMLTLHVDLNYYNVSGFQNQNRVENKGRQFPWFYSLIILFVILNIGFGSNYGVGRNASWNKEMAFLTPQLFSEGSDRYSATIHTFTTLLSRTPVFYSLKKFSKRVYFIWWRDEIS